MVHAPCNQKKKKNARLSAWAEATGVRAMGQAGFRQGHATTDNCFVLRALLERARANRRKLYVCLVDLEKAFDSVDRPLLWAALRRAGIGGCMLGAVQALYADVPVCVRTAEGLSGTFQSVLGVKQGCPLSPLLFGIFLDDFEQHLQRTVPASAAQLPALHGHTVPPLLFADDMLLMSTSPAGLRAQLTSLQHYCDAKKLTVNAAKTHVLIMRPGGGSSGRLAADESFSYAGQPLQVAAASKYLGLTFSQLSRVHGLTCCADALAKAGRQAMHAMRRRAWELGAGAEEHQVRLFDILVKPILSYGCEVWGVDLLGRPDSAPERVHRWFCRRVLGLPQGASSAVVLAELGRWPLHVQWVRQLVRFWNRMLSLQEEGADRPVLWAWQDNLALMHEQEATGQAAGPPCWARKWFSYLRSCPSRTGTLVWLAPLQEEPVVGRAITAYLREAEGRDQGGANFETAAAASAAPRPAHSTGGFLAGGPAVSPPTPPRPGWSAAGNSIDGVPGARTRTGLGGGIPAGGCARADSPRGPLSEPCPASKFAMYVDSVRDSTPLGELAPHLVEGEVRNWRHRASLTRFRCSCHDLRIERDRYLPAAVKPPRHLRTCLFCTSGAVEDEHHMVFACPLYSQLRFEFADLFSTPCPTLGSFLSQRQERVAHFVHECLTFRRSIAQMSLAGSANAHHNL